jgi:hypothetical protein
MIRVGRHVNVARKGLAHASIGFVDIEYTPGEELEKLAKEVHHERCGRDRANEKIVGEIKPVKGLGIPV